MKTFKLLIVLLFIGLQTIKTSAQDVHFSQYRMTPLMVNPANAGFNYNLRASLNYREQWKSVATPFTTSAFSFDMNTIKDQRKRASLGIGFQFLNDKAGDAKMGMTQGNLNISSAIKLDNLSKLSFGIMAGFGQRSIDYSNLRWENQYASGAYNSNLVSGENLNSNSFTYLDAGAGFAWSYGKDQGYITQNNGVKVNFGASVYHFGLPSTSFIGSSSEKMNTKIIAHGNMELGKTNTNLTFIPEIYFLQQGAQREILVGNVFRYLINEGSQFTGFVKTTAISLGLNYRLKDALITSIQFDYANYSIGFSYDFNLSSLSTTSNSRGGFEFSLRFVTPNPFTQGSRARI
jgi:type IX secretion system PorP/SprF family membrane protein